MEYWVLYLCSIADSVHTLLMVLSIVGLIVSVILFFMSVCSSQCDVCGTRTCVAKGVKKSGVNHSEEVQRIPDNAMKAVNRYLESLAPNDSIQ